MNEEDFIPWRVYGYRLDLNTGEIHRIDSSSEDGDIFCINEAELGNKYSPPVGREARDELARLIYDIEHGRKGDG